jgi:N-acetylneuraminate synthase
MFEIGDQKVGDEHPTFIIAEAGSNHNGRLGIAKKLIDEAAEAGADAVKFQTFRAKDMYVEESGEVEYLEDEREIYDIIEDMEMPYEWIPELHEYCQEKGIFFMSTPFDERSADELEEYVPAYKVASYTSSHIPFLKHLAEKDKPIIMSTGAHEISEVQDSVEALGDAGVEDFALLQCVAAYPTPLESINVKVVNTLREKFSVQTGLSDHTLDPVIAPATAVALGANIVEKHFTLDKSMEGPDHEFALEPDQLDRMVTAIRNTEKALGNGEKKVLEVEEELHDMGKRRIHATTEIKEGERISDENIDILRSGKQENGLNPKYYSEIIGKKVIENFEKSEGVTWEKLEGEPQE